MKHYQQTKRALGSNAQLTIVTDSQSQADEILGELWDRIDRFEARFSRFLATSELTKVNNTTGRQTTVSEAFVKLLSAAIECSAQTDGLYNPLILPQLQQAGYIGSWPEPDNYNATLDYRSRHATSAAQVQIGQNWIKLPTDSALDFGGCGKGYLLDELARYVDAQDVVGYCLSLGGDILCGGLDNHEEPWTIALEHATETDKDALHVSLGEFPKQAIATSGTNKRKGPNWNHLIDPRTGKPTSSDIVTATVLHDSALMADIYAKCLVILGSKDGKKWVEGRQINGVVLQSEIAGAIQIDKWGMI